jgi:ArsR family transcriptional regulator, arsenate/arsenite/antimonite-responsive transcriptional repressor
LTFIDVIGTMGAMPKPLPLLDPVSTAATGCAPLSHAPLSVDDARQLAARLKALADPARLRLLSLLLASVGQEACTCNLTEPLGLSQPTVSHHLKKLAEAGLVTGERRGVWTYYRVVPDALSALAQVLLTPHATLVAPKRQC